MIRRTLTGPGMYEGLEAITIESIDDLVALRADEAWHEGAMSLLTYPSTVEGYIGVEPPKLLTGFRLDVGDTVIKGRAGDFERVELDDAGDLLEITAKA